MIGLLGRARTTPNSPTSKIVSSPSTPSYVNLARDFLWLIQRCLFFTSSTLHDRTPHPSIPTVPTGASLTRRVTKYYTQNSLSTMPFFKITQIRSAIGLPKKTTGVLKALGLRKRMATVFHPVSPQVAGQIMAIKELVAVSEVEQALTRSEMRANRRPDPGYYIETPASEALDARI